MPHGDDHNPKDDADAPRRAAPRRTQAAPRVPAGWAWALAVVAAVLAVRYAFLAFSPVGLAADEAHYWDWSRTPALSYYSKGPGVAWLIALGTAIAGDTAFGVRLFAPLCGAALSLLLAAAARLAFPTVRNAALFAVLATLCLPIFHGLGLIMTIDPPYLVCWAAGVLLTIVLARRLTRGASVAEMSSIAAGIGLAIGIGFLFKYTALVLAPCVLAYVWLDRRRLGVNSPRAIAMLAAGALAVTLCMLPVLIWNANEDWPTVRHLLGHLGLPGGDTMPAPDEPREEPGTPWPIEVAGHIALYLGGQLALAGPMLVLIVISTLAAQRRPRRRQQAHADAQPTPPGSKTTASPPHPEPRFEMLLLVLGWPLLVMYLLVAFFTEPEGNWPIAGYISLLILAARDVAVDLPDRARRLRAWRAGTRRPRQGILARRPESPVQLAWHWALGYGLAGFFGILLIVPADGLPIIGDLIPLHRLNRGPELAAHVQPLRARVLADTGHEPLIITTRYTAAAWLGFYLPGQPRVASAASYRGDRKSSYDFFPQTRLDNPALAGRPVVLVGGRAESWIDGPLRFGELRTVETGRDDKPLCVATTYLGLTPTDDATHANDPTAPRE